MTVPKTRPAAPKGGPTQTERSWITILAAWKRSGLGVREFCRRRRLRESAFWYWRRELPDRDRRRRERRTAGPGKPTLRILPVRLVKEPLSRVPLEILSGGRTLRISGDFDSAVLRKVLFALEGRP
jgi:hypothetical protein